MIICLRALSKSLEFCGLDDGRCRGKNLERKEEGHDMAGQE